MSAIEANATQQLWKTRYGRRHGFFRLHEESAVPNGRRGRITIYQRGQASADPRRQTFILSWCSGGKKTKERVVGDKFDAVRRADEINTLLESGLASSELSRLDAGELVKRFLEHANRRADAGEICTRTAERYRSALGHLVAFCRLVEEARKNRVWTPNRDFVLRFRTFLQGREIAPNGHPNATKRPLRYRGISFILATVRSLVRWAVLENMLPPAAQAAFSGLGRGDYSPPLFSSLPISTEELISLIRSADLYQLVLFSFHIFHGARVAEPCWLMIEFFDAQEQWVHYRCVEELGHRTKGVVDKCLPVPAPMCRAVRALIDDRCGGLLLLKRGAGATSPTENRRCVPLSQIVQSVNDCKPRGWAERGRVSRTCLRHAGAISGDDVRKEFDRLLQSAGVRKEITPKALRHYFATTLELADVPYYTRKFLLGHRLGTGRERSRDVTAVYTHLTPSLIREAYMHVLEGPLAAVCEAFELRLCEVLSEIETTNR